MIYLGITDPSVLNYANLGQLFKRVFHPLERRGVFWFCSVFYFLHVQVGIFDLCVC